MTPQEAIEIITNAIQTDNMTVEQDRALAMAQKALGKQLPKETVPTSENIFEFGNCPNCGTEFNSELICEYEIQFCPYCGQALDWNSSVSEFESKSDIFRMLTDGIRLYNFPRCTEGRR